MPNSPAAYLHQSFFIQLYLNFPNLSHRCKLLSMGELMGMPMQVDPLQSETLPLGINRHQLGAKGRSFWMLWWCDWEKNKRLREHGRIWVQRRKEGYGERKILLSEKLKFSGNYRKHSAGMCLQAISSQQGEQITSLWNKQGQPLSLHALTLTTLDQGLQISYNF